MENDVHFFEDSYSLLKCFGETKNKVNNSKIDQISYSQIFECTQISLFSVFTGIYWVLRSITITHQFN